MAALLVEESRVRAALSGLLFGAAFWGLSIPWISFVVVHFGGQPAWMGPVCLALTILILSPVWALLGFVIVGATRARSLTRLFAFPVLWMAAEHARTVVAGGFPWNLTANALYRHPVFLQSASLWGAYGIGFLVVLEASLLAGLVLMPRFRRSLTVAAAAIPLLIFGPGRAEMLRHRRSRVEVRVALVQPNIEQEIREDPEKIAATYVGTIHLLRQAAARRPDLLVVPESTFPMTWMRSERLRRDLTSIVADCGCSVLFNDVDEVAGGRYYNAARLLTRGGLADPPYRKIHLVPFGEYVPLPKVFFFVRAISQEVGGFSAASTPVLLREIPMSIGPAVCYEMTYPELPRTEARMGANLFATISNDAWYGRAGAQEQHFAAMVLRAIENRRPFVRAAITGISAAVDSDGRIVGMLGERERGIVEARVPLSGETTPWMRAGWLVPVAADVEAAIMLLFAALRKGL